MSASYRPWPVVSTLAHHLSQVHGWHRLSCMCKAGSEFLEWPVFVFADAEIQWNAKPHASGSSVHEFAPPPRLFPSTLAKFWWHEQPLRICRPEANLEWSVDGNFHNAYYVHTVATLKFPRNQQQCQPWRVTLLTIVEEGYGWAKFVFNPLDEVTKFEVMQQLKRKLLLNCLWPSDGSV